MIIIYDIDLVPVLYKIKQENNKTKSANNVLDLCIKKNDHPIEKYKIIADILDWKYGSSKTLDQVKKYSWFLWKIRVHVIIIKYFGKFKSFFENTEKKKIKLITEAIWKNTDLKIWVVSASIYKSLIRIAIII